MVASFFFYPYGTNRNIKIFIGSDDPDTRREFSELCGQKKVKNFSVNTSAENLASSNTGASNQPLITIGMHIDGVSGFANSMFTIFMIVGGAMLIPAGQTLFARLFGQADDMRAGGGWLRSAFYGGRIAGAMTIGLAAKGLKGLAHIFRKHKNKSHNNGDSGSSSDSDEGDKYSDGGESARASDG